jgi:RimJ/RimL family protein N-acetyltransferase
VVTPSKRCFVAPAALCIFRAAGCVVRTFARADASPLQTALCDPAVWRSFVPEDGGAVLAPEEIEGHLAWLHRPDAWAFAITREADGELIGSVQAIRGKGVMARSVELAMWLVPAAHRGGVTRPVACAFIDWLFRCEGVLCVHAGTYHPNRAAVGALFAAGFHLQARITNAAVKDGHLMDRLIFVKMNPAVQSMPRAPERDVRWLAGSPQRGHARA